MRPWTGFLYCQLPFILGPGTAAAGLRQRERPAGRPRQRKGYIFFFVTFTGRPSTTSYSTMSPVLRFFSTTSAILTS
jgi:hypothetical protein